MALQKQNVPAQFSSRQTLDACIKRYEQAVRFCRLPEQYRIRPLLMSLQGCRYGLQSGSHLSIQRPELMTLVARCLGHKLQRRCGTHSTLCDGRIRQ